jgi:hypothetical protein
MMFPHQTISPANDLVDQAQISLPYFAPCRRATFSFYAYDSFIIISIAYNGNTRYFFTKSRPKYKGVDLFAFTKL